MGRSRSSRPAPARRAPAPAQPKRPAPAPAPVHSAPAPAPQHSSGGGMMGGLMGTVAQGMAFGTGSAIAHRAVGAAANAIGGGSDSREAPVAEQAPAQAQQYQQQQQQQPMCYNDQKAFLECLNTNMNDISACQFYLDQFNQCKQQSAYM